MNGRSFKRAKAAVLLKMLLFLIIFLAVPQVARTQTARTTGSVHDTLLIFIVDNTSIEEIAELDSWRHFFEQYSCALLSARTGTPLNNQNRASIYASISAGDKLELDGRESSRVFNTVETVYPEILPAEFIYEQNMGASPGGRIVFLDFNSALKLIKENASTGLARLGEDLKNAGIKRVILGNADDSSVFDRSAALALIDFEGAVDSGDVSRGTLIKTPDKPGDYRINREKILDLIEQQMRQKRRKIIVIDTGDTVRIERKARLLAPSVYAENKKEALDNIALLIRESEKRFIDDSAAIMILSTLPPVEEMQSQIALGFVFLKKTNPSGAFYLRSESTRKEGLVSLPDITATILNFFNLSALRYSGNPAVESARTDGESAVSYLTRLRDRIVNVERIRPTAISLFVALIVVVCLAGILVLIFEKPFISEKLLQALLIYPGVFILFSVALGPLYSVNPDWGLTTLMGLSTLTTVVLMYLARKKISHEKIIVYTNLLVTILVLLSSSMFPDVLRFSILGYSMNIGARFYGVGNEFAGMVISGCLILLLYALAAAEERNQHFTLVAAGVFFAGGLAFIMGYPYIGANVGSAITAFAAAFFATLFWSKGRTKTITAGVFLVAAVLIAALGFYVSSKLTGFHLSKFLVNLEQGNMDYATAILYRKIETNFKLLRYTAWNKFLLVIVLGLPFLLLKNELIRKFSSEKFKAGRIYLNWLLSASMGAIIAFLFNDSGVVASATLLMFPFLTFLSAMISTSMGVRNESL